MSKKLRDATEKELLQLKAEIKLISEANLPISPETRERWEQVLEDARCYVASTEGIKKGT